MSTYRPEYLAALRLLAEAFDEVMQAGYARPVLVGGAAVEFYTGGAVMSGDFDVITLAQDELEAALINRGFVRPTSGLLRGLHHPMLGVGVEVVSGPLFDGASDTSRIRLVPVGSGAVALPPVEDMIADRMGQFAATGRDLEMLQQAVILYQTAGHNLVTPLDAAYLDARIKHETAGAYGLDFLVKRAQSK